MTKILMLKFVDSTYKECEVTGRDMGGDDVYYMPLSSLKLGRVAWDTNNNHINHYVEVCEMGADFVVVEVYNWRGNKLGGPYKLYAGDEKGGSYYFGEWSYGYSVSLVWSEMK